MQAALRYSPEPRAASRWDREGGAELQEALERRSCCAWPGLGWQVRAAPPTPLLATDVVSLRNSDHYCKGSKLENANHGELMPICAVLLDFVYFQQNPVLPQKIYKMDKTT
ncbi:Hypothetical predicted protein [Podarcis lilfordi]|uniref:Uncharacterized protein n=1 Tax=Podarcis lilfordi TaxID=74358 RepID=A0AA35L1F5_9SAUR|nr:Hypothetical predicted protein [Podarcis lilfordi]